MASPYGNLKIALVKQEVYQDLYVCPADEKDPLKVLMSSMGRVGMIGLIAELGADFYIVREENTRETRIWKKVIPQHAESFRSLKTHTLNQLPGQEFKEPGSPFPNGKFAVDCHTIDWDRYDVVISLNVSLPSTLIKKYPRTLFGYMIGEANLASKRVRFGYDVCLNQMATGKVADGLGVIDFPYTFVKSDTLEKLMMRHLGRPSENSGIFSEINSSSQRPVRDIPEQFLPIAEQTGHAIRLHRQHIGENLKQVYDARYFVKVGGRNIRGNSIIEAISLGTPVLMSPDEVIHRELLPESSWVKTPDEAIRKIRELDRNPEERTALLVEQRRRLDEYIFEKPMQSLVNCLHDKRRMSSFRRMLYRLSHP